MKSTYSETTWKKNQLNCSVPEVRRQYDEGEREPPCVLMRCVEFNVDFWKALVDKKERLRQPSASSTPKKRKIIDLSSLSSEGAVEKAVDDYRSSLPNTSTRKVIRLR